MEQCPLVIITAVQILEDKRLRVAHFIDETGVESLCIKELRARPHLPDADKMRFAARRRADQELHGLRPAGPRIDQLHCGNIAVTDKEILGAERRAMGQIER